VKGYAAVADALTFFTSSMPFSATVTLCSSPRVVQSAWVLHALTAAHSMLQHARHSRASQSRRSVYATGTICERSSLAGPRFCAFVGSSKPAVPVACLAITEGLAEHADRRAVFTPVELLFQRRPAEFVC
jgi:hypothetical protein